MFSLLPILCGKEVHHIDPRGLEFVPGVDSEYPSAFTNIVERILTFQLIS